MPDRICTKCSLPKDEEEFYMQKSGVRSSWCNTCKNKASNDWYHKNKDRISQQLICKKYGLTVEQFGSLLAEQGFVCAICSKSRPLQVDHDHETDIVRGLLCGRCNKAIGLLGDDALIVQRAAKYLDRI